jgi:hypothetical protein
MTLVDCPVCGHRISPAAEACPQCGHPSRAAVRPPAGPRCYACSAEATTRCQNCGVFSCPLHLDSVEVLSGEGSNHELRCQSCKVAAEEWKERAYIVSAVILGVGLVVMVAILSH